MKERPILFSTAMVQSILAGRKAMTRRAVTNLDLIQDWGDGCEDGAPCYADEYGDWHKTEGQCPYGQPGDLLWVRETWSKKDDGNIVFKADDPDYQPFPFGWKPSIHMKKKHCRIWLKVTDVRVERLRDISEPDSIAEGIKEPWIHNSPRTDFAFLWDSINGKPRAKGYDISWDANPWVWVVEFERVERPQAAKEFGARDMVMGQNTF